MLKFKNTFCNNLKKFATYLLKNDKSNLKINNNKNTKALVYVDD